MNDSQNNDSINIISLIKICLNRKIFISYFVVSAAFISVIVYLFLPNIYRSEAILSPSETDTSFGSSLQGLGGLASMAGINLPSQGTNSIEAFESLTTLSFFEERILPYIKLEDLMAVDSWDAKENTIIYDRKKFNSENNEWVRKAKFPQTPKPSSQEAFKKFKKILSVAEDQKTKLVTVSIDHRSPEIANSWASIMVREINKKFRSDHKQQASIAIDYLNSLLAVTNYSEVRKAIAQLIQSETQKMIVIESNPEYVYTVIDPPVSPELKAKPRRALICIGGTLLGLIIGILSTLYRDRKILMTF